METLQFSIQAVLEDAICQVFSTMAATNLTNARQLAEEDLLPLSGCMFVGTVPFAGSASGLIHMYLPGILAAHVSSAILGLSADEVGENDICDVVSELSNMVGGRVKSVLSDNGHACDLSLPTVMKGHDVRIKTELQGGNRYLMGFDHEDSVLTVELAIKLQPK